MDGGIPHLLAAALRPARTRLTSTNNPSDTRGDTARRAPGHTGHHRTTGPASEKDTTPETGQ